MCRRAATVCWVVLAIGCGAKEGAHHRSDIGPCITTLRDGQEYWLCEKLSVPPSRERTPQADRASALESRRAAQAAAEQAMHDARVARDLVDGLQRETEAMTVELDRAVDALASARTQPERDAARATLDRLRWEKEALEARIAAAKATATGARHPDGKLNFECLHNPLAKGCS